MTEHPACAPAQSAQSKDWLRRPVGIIFWWGIPIALGVSTNFLALLKNEWVMRRRKG